jgi:hypothetical protein
MPLQFRFAGFMSLDLRSIPSDKEDSLSMGVFRVLPWVWPNAIPFSLEMIQAAGFLSSVVFLTASITKMHDSLPLELFSPDTFADILQNGMTPEMDLAPWCLMTAALTITGFDTKTRCHLLEIGCWFLVFSQQLPATRKLPKRIPQKITAGNIATLSSSD